jgi:tRNA dimethylallyltransferase
MKNFLIVLLGPTGVGKTDTSIKISRHFNCNIISADSRQFYREMRIGTAVPDETQLSAVKHHFIRFIPVTSYYSASLFERDVLGLLERLFTTMNVVMMTGGSGLYIDAVCRGIDDIPDTEPSIRRKLRRKYREEGLESLRMDLKVLDPEYYSRTDLKNPKRILRALEVCESTGQSYSSFLGRAKRIRDFGIIKIGLERPRKELYRMIESRVDRMIAEGLEEEARGLHSMRELNSLNSVGYREFFDFFEGKTSREKAIELIKRNSRRYAKRQITWWGRDNNIRWFHPDNVKEIIEYIEINIASSTC